MGEERLFQGGDISVKEDDYSREAINRGTAIIRGNTVFVLSRSLLPNHLNQNQTLTTHNAHRQCRTLSKQLYLLSLGFLIRITVFTRIYKCQNVNKFIHTNNSNFRSLVELTFVTFIINTV